MIRPCRDLPLFPTGDQSQEDRSDLSHAAVYDVDGNGLRFQPLFINLIGQTSRAVEIWEISKSTNVEDYTSKAVGNVVIIREPSPLLCCGALYYE